MDDEQCRITVIGARRRVDIAVPARAPIAQYLPQLTRICGQAANDTFPTVWSLALPGAQPLSPGTSLADAEIRDGTTFYLRDAAAAETEEPVITDLAELVEDAGKQLPTWNRRGRALATLGIGLGALVVAVFALAIGSPRSLAAAPVALVAGFGPALLAGFASRRGWSVPAPLMLAAALSAVPLLGLAGRVLPLLLPGMPTSPIAVAAGACVGALAAVLAVVDICTLLAMLVTVTALPVTVLLVLLHANSYESAAVVGVVGLGMIIAAPVAAGRLGEAPSIVRPTPPDATPADEVATAVARGRCALATLSVIGAVAAAAAMVILAGAGDFFALGLTLCLSLALLALAEQTRVPAAVVPVLAAGAAGLVVLAVRVPAHLFPAYGVYGPLAAAVVAAAVLGLGMAASARPRDGEAGRSALVRAIGVGLSILSVPAAIGVFGVFTYLFGVGGGIY